MWARHPVRRALFLCGGAKGAASLHPGCGRAHCQLGFLAAEPIPGAESRAFGRQSCTRDAGVPSANRHFSPPSPSRVRKARLSGGNPAPGMRAGSLPTGVSRRRAHPGCGWGPYGRTRDAGGREAAQLSTPRLAGFCGISSICRITAGRKDFLPFADCAEQPNLPAPISTCLVQKYRSRLSATYRSPSGYPVASVRRNLATLIRNGGCGTNWRMHYGTFH